MLKSTQARLGELDAQKTRLIDAYSRGVLSLDELAGQKTALDKEISDLAQAISVLRAETEPLLLTAEHIESIEAVAAEICDGVDVADDNKQAQRAIFQLLDVQVLLSYDGERRWADLTCTLGTARCTVEYNTIAGNDPHTIFGGHLSFLSDFVSIRARYPQKHPFGQSTRQHH
jgi:hypothetical protein